MTIEQLAFETKVIAGCLSVAFLAACWWGWATWKEYNRINKDVEPVKDNQGAMSYRPKPGKVWNPMQKRWPPNAPCPCGQKFRGKQRKWKHCCKNKMPKAVDPKAAEQLDKYIDDQTPALLGFMSKKEQDKILVRQAKQGNTGSLVQFKKPA